MKKKKNKERVYVLREEDFSKSPKKDKKPPNAPMTDVEYKAELEKFLDKVKKELKIKKPRVKSSRKKSILRIPKEYQNKKGEFTLKTDIVKNNVKKDPKPDYEPNEEADKEYQKFVDSIKKTIKKKSKKVKSPKNM